MSNAECYGCPVQLWCAVTQEVEPKIIERSDETLVRFALDAVVTEAKGKTVQPVFNAAVAKLDERPVLDADDFVQRVEQFSVLEGIRSDTSDSFDRSLNLHEATMELVSTRRQYAVLKLAVAKGIAPHVENGCESGLAMKRERLLGKKTLKVCGAPIPENLMYMHRTLDY